MIYFSIQANNAVGRKRRSGRSWYESMMALEKAVASEFYQIEVNACEKDFLLYVHYAQTQSVCRLHVNALPPHDPDF